MIELTSVFLFLGQQQKIDKFIYKFSEENREFYLSISLYSIKFEVGIDNSVNGRIIFAAAIDLTIFGKRLYLNMNINLKNPAAAIKNAASRSVDEFKKKANPKSKTDVDERVYDSPNPYSDFELSGECQSLGPFADSAPFHNPNKIKQLYHPVTLS